MWAQEAKFKIYDSEDLLDMILTDVPGSDKVRTNTMNLVISPSKKIIEEELGKEIKRLQIMTAQKDVLGLKEESEPAPYKNRWLSSSVANETSHIYGRLVDTCMIMRQLNSREGNDDVFRVIPIVGMGGIGKTTLASMVFHEYKSLTEFDLKGWVHVLDGFDVRNVIESLLESISGQKSTVDSCLEYLQQKLKKKLQGKRFFIVLDDYRSTKSEDWDELKICFSVGDVGSRVIVTTRNIEVAHSVTTSHDLPYELKKLSRNESWLLFENFVFRDRNSSKHPLLKYIGLEIVNRCKGIPMNIKMIGELLLSKGYDETEWRRVLNSKIWGSTKIIPSLMLSYYDLPLGLQNCFAYCSIFPKKYSFTMEEVTVLWIGEGLIKRFCEGNRYEDVAIKYFTHLRSKFFFQESSSDSSKFVMPDLVHDLAMNVSMGLCVDLHNVNVQSRRLSYIQGKDEFMLKYMSGKKLLNHLRTFLPLKENGFPKKEGGFYFDKKLFGDLLSNFKLLRVLSLSGYGISKLPDSVGDMKLLRYLDLSFTYIDNLSDMICRLYNLQILLLSDCHKLERFPTEICNLNNLRRLDLSRSGIDSVPDKICGLKNLQILLLSDCSELRRLPAEICSLINLRHLNIEGTYLEEMPDGIGRMTNIQTLSNFVIGRYKSNQMREFEELLHLQGKLHISSLRNIEDPKDVVTSCFKTKEYIEELALEWEATGQTGTKLDDKYNHSWKEENGNIDRFIYMKVIRRSTKLDEKVLNAIDRDENIDRFIHMEVRRERSSELDEKVLDAIDAHKNLKSLTIRWYGGKRLSDWIVGLSPSFTAMVSLCISYCFHLEVLPSLGNLPFLKYLEMEGLNRIESFGEEFYGDCTTPFQSLEKLIIDRMEEWKTWCFPGDDRLAFQKLKDLQIQRCGRLTKIPYCFPSLTRLDIKWCHNLVKLEMCGEAEKVSSLVTAYRHPFQSLRISCCRRLKEIPNCFVNSDSFEIELCQKLVSIPRLQHVRKLTLRHKDEVMEELTIEISLGDLYSAEIHRFTSLKRLKLLIPFVWARDEDSEVSIRLPPNLSDFTLHDDSSHHGHYNILITEISKLSRLTKLQFSPCYDLDSFPDVELPSILKFLRIEMCYALKTIPDRFLKGCSESLQDLWISECFNLECLPSTLSTLESLQTLHIDRCFSIHRWPNISRSGPNYLTNLSDLHISNCHALECLPDGFHKAAALHTLHIEGCRNLCVSQDGFPANLRILQIIDSGKMTPFVEMVLPKLTSLATLELRGFPYITTLDRCLPESIQNLTIRRFPRLKSISGVLPNLKHLTRLQVDDHLLVDQNSWP
uniref:NB-ARC domain-containing protein n=1 Tax=Kalanchoe fedtschenkoi TaxID=63787 RepID=A0A7N0VHA8_KALFE